MSDQEEVYQNYPPDLEELFLWRINKLDLNTNIKFKTDKMSDEFELLFDYEQKLDEDYQNYPPDLLECDLCNNYDYRTGKVSLHGSWNCHRYNTPQKARQRCIFKNLCIACIVPLSDHKEECDESNISYYNGDPSGSHRCYRCMHSSHVFWTCDLKHPGSQFNNSSQDNVSKKSNKICCSKISELTKCSQEINESQKETKLENPTISLGKEKIEIKREKVTEVIKPSIISTKNTSNSEDEICNQSKKELKNVQLDIVANYDSSEIKSNTYKGREDPSKIEKCQEERNLIKALKQQIDELKLEHEKTNDQHLNKISDFQRQMSKLKELKKIYEVSNEKVLKDKLAACEYKLTKYEEIFDQNEKEVSNLKGKCSELVSKLTVSEKSLLTSQEHIKNAQAHFECLKHRIINNEEVINQKEKTIDSMQEQYQIMQQENVKHQDINLDLSINNIKQEEKSEIQNSINSHEKKLENTEIILSSGIEKVLLEVSNEKSRATEHRKNLNEKLCSLSTNLQRYTKRKLMKYRCERGTQIASFEERIKREFVNQTTIAAHEEIRLLENKYRKDNQDTNLKIEKLEELFIRNHQEMTDDMNQIKESNKDLKLKLNDKEEKISKSEKLVKDLIEMRKTRNIKSRSIAIKRKIRVRSFKKNKINEETNVKQKVIQMMNRITSVSNKTIQRVKKKVSTSESLISNINKETCLYADNFNNSKLEKKENNKIPQKSKIRMKNDKIKYLEKDGKSKCYILNSNESNGNISKISPKIPKVLSERADSYKKLTETHGFAIRMEDKVLLYNKDPRLRTNLGKQIRKSNKFECLRNDILYENKIFREI